MPKNIVTSENNQTDEKPKVKRGRRTKKEIEEAKLAQEKAEKEKSENVILVTEEQKSQHLKKEDVNRRVALVNKNKSHLLQILNQMLSCICFLRFESTGNRTDFFMQCIHMMRTVYLIMSG